MAKQLCYLKAHWNGEVYNILSKDENTVTILDEKATNGERILPIAEVTFSRKASGRRRKRIKHSSTTPKELSSFNLGLAKSIAEFKKSKG